MEIFTNFRALVLVIAASVLGITFYLATIGFGLPTQNDPLSVRQESANHSRPFNGGTRTFGK